MTGLDTNVLIRYLAQDDPKQSSDALIGQIALAHGCEKTATFDRAAGKLPGFEILA